MPLYKNVNGELVAMTPDEEAAFEAERQAYLPPSPPPVTRWEVRKLLLVERIPDDRLADFDAALAALPLRNRLRYSGAVTFWNDDPEVIAFLDALGLDATVILAPDPLLNPELAAAEPAPVTEPAPEAASLPLG